MKYTIYDLATGALSNPETPFAEATTFLQPGQGGAETDDDVDARFCDWGAHTLTWSFEIARVKAACVDRVNDEVGAFRRRFITVIPGQAETYLAKEREARGWVTGDDPATVPFLAAEAAARGVSIDAVAALVIGLADQWTQLGAAIEGLRQGALVGIAAAETPVAAQAIANGLGAALEALLP